MTMVGSTAIEFDAKLMTYLKGATSLQTHPPGSGACPHVISSRYSAGGYDEISDSTWRAPILLRRNSASYPTGRFV